VNWSRWMTWLGVAIAAVGVVIGVWLQVLTSTVSSGAQGSVGHAVLMQERLGNVTVALGMIGAGALLAVAAQIMGMMQYDRESTEPLPTSPQV
jgi:hypothetical protein